MDRELVNMHIHTTNSDGINSVREVLNMAKENNVKVISITDHDSCDAYSQISERDLVEYGGRLIVGCEIKCVFKGQAIEVLAYGYDIEKMTRSRIVNKEEKIKTQERYLRLTVERLKQMGIEVEDDLHISKYGEYAGTLIYKSITKYECNKRWFTKGAWEDSAKFYRETCANKDSKLYIDEGLDYPSLEEVIEEVHNMGGIVFLAHLAEYKVKDKYRFLDSILRKTEIDGIECSHPSMRGEECNRIKEIAKKNDKLMCGGSDYHGDGVHGKGFVDGTNEVEITVAEMPWIGDCEYKISKES